jgi:hypothetical protein
MVCAERTTSSEIILDAPIKYLAEVDHVEYRFGLFGRSEIFLDALDGTLRLRGSSRKLISVHLEIVMELILDVPDGTPR